MSAPADGWWKARWHGTPCFVLVEGAADPGQPSYALVAGRAEPVFLSTDEALGPDPDAASLELLEPADPVPEAARLEARRKAVLAAYSRPGNTWQTGNLSALSRELGLSYAAVRGIVHKAIAHRYPDDAGTARCLLCGTTRESNWSRNHTACEKATPELLRRELEEGR